MIKFFLKQRPGFFIGLCCSLLLLSACATTQQSEDVVGKRAQARWDAILADDLMTAYEYLSPGYRSSVSSIQYVRLILNKQVVWTGARYLGRECEEAKCEVKIALDYALIGVLPGVKTFEATKDIEETWLLIDGVWYFVPK